MPEWLPTCTDQNMLLQLPYGLTHYMRQHLHYRMTPIYIHTSKTLLKTLLSCSWREARTIASRSCKNTLRMERGGMEPILVSLYLYMYICYCIPYKCPMCTCYVYCIGDF